MQTLLFSNLRLLGHFDKRTWGEENSPSLLSLSPEKSGMQTFDMFFSNNLKEDFFENLKELNWKARAICKGYLTELPFGNLTQNCCKSQTCDNASHFFQDGVDSWFWVTWRSFSYYWRTLQPWWWWILGSVPHHSDGHQLLPSPAHCTSLTEIFRTTTSITAWCAHKQMRILEIMQTIKCNLHHLLVVGC